MDAINEVIRVLNFCCIRCSHHITTEKLREVRSREQTGHTIRQNVTMAQAEQITKALEWYVLF